MSRIFNFLLAACVVAFSVFGQTPFKGVTVNTNTGIFGAGALGSGVKLTLNNGVVSNSTAVNLTGSLTNVSVNGTLTPSSPASRSFATDADTLYSIGDSFTFGASATSYTNTYVSKLAASLGLSANNIANGSFSIADANWIIFPGWTVTNSTGPSSYVFSSPSSITEDQNWTVLIGFNDLRTGAGTGTAPSAARYRLGLDHLLRYLSIPHTAKRWAVSPDASTGSWTPSTLVAYTNKAATSSSGTLTFSNVIGSEVYVGFVSWATNYGGTISVTVDGAAVESRSVASAAYGNREYINGSDPVIPNHLGPYGNGKLDFCPHVISATGLGLGAHTVVVTAASNPVTVIWVAGNGWKRTLREGPNVFLGTIPRQSPWTGAGTDALHAAYNAQLRSAINTARSAGLRVAAAPVGEYYNPGTEQDVDGVHPTNTGHTTIAEAFEQSMAGEAPAMAEVGYQTEPSQTGSFTSLTVSGTSSLVGNVTLTGRLLVLPTATSGGTSARFGYGTVNASSVSIQHSDSDLNRELIIGGNSIYSRVNTNGAAANLSIGTAGVAVVNPGAATVAETLGVSGAATFSDGVTVSDTFTGTSGTETLAALNYTVNQASGTASSRGLSIAATTTAVGSGTHRFISTSDNGADRFYVQTDGRIVVFSPNGTSGMNLRGDSATDSRITLSYAQTLDRHMFINGNGIYVRSADGVTPNNLSLGEAGSNVTIQNTASVAGALTASSTIELGHASDTTLARSAAGVVTIEGVTVAERPTTTALTYSGTNVTLTATSQVLHGNTLTLTNNCLLTITSSDGASGGITIVPHASTSYTVYLDSAIKLLGGGSSFVVTNSASETVNLEWKQTLRGGSSVVLANKAVYP